MNYNWFFDVIDERSEPDAKAAPDWLFDTLAFGGDDLSDPLGFYNRVDGTAGDDVLSGTSGQDIVEGLAGDDELRGLEGDDIIRGGAGDDYVYGDAGNDKLNGGEGWGDYLSYEDAPAGIFLDIRKGTVRDGFGGVDRFGGFELFVGSDHDDVMLGDDGANYFVDTAGADRISGRGGRDVFEVGEAFSSGVGDDHFNGGAGYDILIYTHGVVDGVKVNLEAGRATGASIGQDTVLNFEGVFGSSYADTLLGDAGENDLYGYGGDDALSGRAGDDFLSGAEGDDVLHGGAGVDTVVFETRFASADGVKVNLATGIGGGGDHGTDILRQIENVQATGYADTVLGDAENNELHGWGGDDTLAGREGDDALHGGAGDDILNGGLGDDTIDGGDGSDVYIINANYAEVTVTDLGGGQVRIDHALAGSDTVTGVETFRFKDGDRTLAQLAQREVAETAEAAGDDWSGGQINDGPLRAELDGFLTDEAAWLV